jgi:hypothetical protein
MANQDGPEGASSDSPEGAPSDSPAGAPSRDPSDWRDGLDAALSSVQRLVREATPRTVSGDQALAISASFAAIEKAAASGVSLFTPVVVERGSFTKEGHTSAQDWLGSLSGTSASKAKGRLAAAERAAVSPQLTEALHEAELSPDQLDVMTTVAAEVPEATGDLLDLVEQGASHQELSDTATRLRAAKRSMETERVRRARVHANRQFTTHQAEGGGIRGSFFCDEVQWAQVNARLEREAKARWKAAGSADSGQPGDSLAAHRLDAFIDLMSGLPDFDTETETEAGSPPASAGMSAPRSRSTTKVETLVVIDAAALRRGTTEGDELCEIEGIGPVSVQAATELLTEGGLRYLVKEGFDIKTVTKATRDIARSVDMALVVRDRTCARPGCGKRLGLERDHREVDFAENGPTELDNLVRLCPQCHDLKTFGGWRLEGGPGAWKWVAPPKPPSAQQMARTRKVAVAKAKAFVTKHSSGPRRT